MINSNNHSGPSRVIINVTNIEHTFPDNEVYAQKVELSCGHWAYNTYGNRYPEFKIGDRIKCLRCQAIA